MLDQMESETPTSSRAGTLLLCVRNPAEALGDNPQMVSISARRCAIGADESCNLRVRGPAHARCTV